MLDFGSTTKGKHPVDAIHFMAQHGVLKMSYKINTENWELKYRKIYKFIAIIKTPSG